MFLCVVLVVFGVVVWLVVFVYLFMLVGWCVVFFVCCGDYVVVVEGF